MKRQISIRTLLVVGFCGLVVGTMLAAKPNKGQRGPKQSSSQDQEEEEQDPLPDDPKLLELHKEFVVKVEKLAKDYEKNRDDDKARACYEQILKLVPGYPNAREMLARISEREATAEHKSMDVVANKAWQDTGIDLIEGMPISIVAEGTWNFRMVHELGPDGMEIPKELRDFHLGALVGMVTSEGEEDPKPFYIGAGTDFFAESSGRLWLRMYDSDNSDNSGKISVEIQGTFDK